MYSLVRNIPNVLRLFFLRKKIPEYYIHGSTRRSMLKQGLLKSCGKGRIFFEVELTPKGKKQVEELASTDSLKEYGFEFKSEIIVKGSVFGESFKDVQQKLKQVKWKTPEFDIDLNQRPLYVDFFIDDMQRSEPVLVQLTKQDVAKGTYTKPYEDS